MSWKKKKCCLGKAEIGHSQECPLIQLDDYYIPRSASQGLLFLRDNGRYNLVFGRISTVAFHSCAAAAWIALCYRARAPGCGGRQLNGLLCSISCEVKCLRSRELPSCLGICSQRARRPETMDQKWAGNLNTMVWPLLGVKNPLVRAWKVREA